MIASTSSRLSVMELTDDERRLCREALARVERIDAHKAARPADFYRPHTKGQRQFHQSKSIVRALFPGNGFGKTRAAGTEVHWWATWSHPFQPTPKRPAIIIWCCETFKQFKILRTQLEEDCFGKGPNAPHFNKSDNVYIWPNGSQMFLVSGDASWTHVQGINPDLVVFDEEPPEALWSEMKMRRRGTRKTRYIFAATATQGMTWMYHDLYLPWLKHHAEYGVDENKAMRCQWHPRLWVWARGGITDNPGADAGDVDWYQSQTFASEAERTVRMGGGFADFSGTPVFDLAALELQRKNVRDGEDGHFVRIPDATSDDPRCFTVITDKRAGKTQRVRQAWVADGAMERGRITIYSQPVRGGRYVCGHDSAYGLATGDFDAGVVLDRMTGEVVAIAVGHWGDAEWAEILFGLCWHFNQAFCLGERQVGLMVMRRLLDEFGYTYQYYRRDETKRDRRQSDELGHHRMSGDLTIPRLRTALGRRVGGKLTQPDVTIRDPELFRQCVKFQFRARRKSESVHDARDQDLTMSAPAGDHDDLVLALGYAVMAVDEVPRFEAHLLPYPEGSAGDLFKINETLHPQRPATPDPFARED